MPVNPALFRQRLEACASAPQTVQDIHIGLEREALRMDAEAKLSRLPHPKALGAALTHPWITTDYSEAMLELITPPDTLENTYAFLEDLHRYAYLHLEADESLWCGSMPCVIAEDPDIPLARYGDSNVGQMKTVYRRGLGLRYSRSMQVIAGVHFNCSMPQEFWRQEFGEVPACEQVSGRYFGALRNLIRHGWIVPYLLGASPAICRSFLSHQPSDLQLESFTLATCYGPEATSLRLSGIGYQNNLEMDTGVYADYNSPEAYINTLRAATATPCAAYERIGLLHEGDYQQLNLNRLQIENEYYGPVRPKCVPEGNEKPSRGLRLRGVEYLELRTLDINPYAPCGVDVPTLHFLTALVLYCLLDDSPFMSALEQLSALSNLQQAAQHGRNSTVMWQDEYGRPSSPLSQQAHQLLEELQPVCALLDQAQGGEGYRQALGVQQARLEDPQQLPSAQMIEAMRHSNDAYVEWTMERSQEHRQSFLQQTLDPTTRARLDQMSEHSHAQQQELEARERQNPISFADYLEQYQAQT